jgi:hypothetical protein
MVVSRLARPGDPRLGVALPRLAAGHHGPALETGSVASSAKAAPSWAALVRRPTGTSDGASRTGTGDLLGAIQEHALSASCGSRPTSPRPASPSSSLVSYGERGRVSAPSDVASAPRGGGIFQPAELGDFSAARSRWMLKTCSANDRGGQQQDPPNQPPQLRLSLRLALIALVYLCWTDITIELHR